MMPNVPTSDNGTATLGMMVAGTLRRNMKITITTNPMVSISENSTSDTEARIVVVMSVNVATFTDAGSVLVSCGNNCWIRFTTAMVFAPGCRWMFTITAGTLFIHAACRIFSTLSSTVATSVSFTGAPFL